MPAKDYLRWSGRTDLFQTSVPFIEDMVTLNAIATPDQVFALRTSGQLFSLLGARAAVGRSLVEADDNSGDAVVIADRLWDRLFHRDSRIVGRHLTNCGRKLHHRGSDASRIRVSRLGRGIVGSAAGHP